MSDRAEFEDEGLIDRFRSSLQYEDRAAAQRLYQTLAGQVDGSSKSGSRLQRFMAACSPLQRPRTRVGWILVLSALLLLASGGAIAGSNILNLGKPVDIQSTNAYFPLSGFHPIPTKLYSHGKPELFFMGAEGPIDKISVERWPVVKALEQFGTLSGVKPVERGCSTVHGGFMNGQMQCSIPSFDFSHARYASKYLSFVSKDLIRPVKNNERKFQTLNSTETALYNKYVRFRGRPQCFKIVPPNHIVNFPCSTYVAYVDSAINYDGLRTLPLITIGGYLQTVSQDLISTDLARTIVLTPLPGTVSSYGVDQGLPFDTVRQALATNRDPSGVSNLVEHVNAEANIMTALICHADGKRPASVCNRPVIKTILKHVK
jgi:hypothetical protein